MSNVLVLTLIANGAIADGSAVNTIQAKVTDATGVAVAAQIVSLTAGAGVGVNIPASLVTDANGVASVNITSATAGTYNVTATLADGTSQNVSVLFNAVTLIGTATSAATLTAATATAAALSPLAELKAKTEAFFEFVEHGIEVLGEEAEAELVSLKEKYW
ncbi:Ig-like domain-containing protein [Rouxiella silvae]|nr:Ig-like domain-containing protein [Rouxiella silvae]